MKSSQLSVTKHTISHLQFRDSKLPDSSTPWYPRVVMTTLATFIFVTRDTKGYLTNLVLVNMKVANRISL